MKRVTFYILLAALLAPVSGGYMWLKLQKVQIREEVEREMDEEELDEDRIKYFAFTSAEAKTELDWHHSREFEYHGQMYDIIDSEVKGDSVFYTVYWDMEETEINEEIAALEQYAREHQTKAINQTFFKSLFYSDNSILLEYPGFNNIPFNLFTPGEYNDLNSSPPVPPPQPG